MTQEIQTEIYKDMTATVGMNQNAFMKKGQVTYTVWHERYKGTNEYSPFDIAVGLFKDIPLGD